MSRPPMNPQTTNPPPVGSSFSSSPLIDTANPDPVTGTPGSHPAGTAIGSASAGVAGAAIGAAAGPVGAALGAVVGAIAGGYAGKGVAEAINPTAEDQYWRANHVHRPYVAPGYDYSDFQPAYQSGWEARARYADASHFDEVEATLREEWQTRRGHSKLDWSRARDAARDAWDRLDRRNPWPPTL